LTNYHVISGAKTVQVKGIGNDFSTLYGVEVIAFDVDLDLALLKLKNQNLSFEVVPYGLSFETSPQGTKAFVLGYPLTGAMGEEIKVTEGLISARSGYKGSISQYQFSAAIQPGNSGSPLFNDNGDVVGVINAKLQGAEGAGYAIKSQYVSTFLKLIDNIQIENNKTLTSNLTLPEKISLLKNNIFIVKSE
jgi:S1-C subfamily serine protease